MFSIFLCVVVHYSSKELVIELFERIQSIISIGLNDTAIPVRQASIDALGGLISKGEASQVSSMKLLPSLVSLISDASSTDVRKTAMLIIKRLAKTQYNVLKEHMKSIIDALVVSVKDVNAGVKIAAERALVHVLRVHSKDSSFDALGDYVATVDRDSAEFIKNYVRRVLAKQVEDSGDESD